MENLVHLIAKDLVNERSVLDNKLAYRNLSLTQNKNNKQKKESRMSWDKVMLELQKEIPFKYYQPYLEPLILERTTERKAIISAPSKTIINKVEKNTHRQSKLLLKL